jgi:hypothetical protein|uniref:Uncharacterized protein n=1 Tax=Siphoviridae sp. ctXZx16 TaxID=2826371 RepID=A0A8S5ML76_9CAUD|nr:MAG TPA: hypothetical protein [Siphoviridae sp. ctXZx16]
MKATKKMKNFLIEVECDGDIDVEGMKELLKDMMDNQVNCTEMAISVSEKQSKFAFHYKELSRNRLITGGLCKIVTCILMMTN